MSSQLKEIGLKCVDNATTLTIQQLLFLKIINFKDLRLLKIELSPRQKTVTFLYSCGATSKEVANKLKLSDRTVQNYIATIQNKFTGVIGYSKKEDMRKWLLLQTILGKETNDNIGILLDGKIMWF
jgi:hypothetical protein